MRTRLLVVLALFALGAGYALGQGGSANQNNFPGQGSGGGVTSVSGDGTLITNSGSTGAVTLTLAYTPTKTICNGTIALGTTAISSGAKSTVATATCTGLATTDNIEMDFNADPSAVTGYAPSANGTLTIVKFPTANTINVYQYNDTASSITPGAVTVNYRVVR